MNKTTNPILIVLGVLFLLGAPICLVGAGAYSTFQPRFFGAATEFQLLFPAADGPRLAGVFEQAQQRYLGTMHQPLPARVELRAAGADHYQIAALDPDAQNAANAVNVLTLSVMDGLRAQGNADERRVNVLQKGEPGRTPSYPNVPRIMTVGIVAAVLCGAIGGGLLVFAFTRRGGSQAAPV